MSEEQPWGESFFETADSVRIACDVVLPFVENAERLRVLEVGCGNGAVASVIAAFGHDVTGIDASPSAIGAAKASASDAAFEVAAPAAFLPQGPEGYNLVISAFGMPSPEGSEAFMRDTARHVGPGGRLVIIEWHSDMAKRLRSPHYTFAPESLVTDFADERHAGFTVDATKRIVAGPLDAADPRGHVAHDAAVSVLTATRGEDD